MKVVGQDVSDVRKGFTAVPNSVFSLDISANEKLLYITLLSYAWSGNSCHPGRERLMKDTSLSKDTLIRAFKGLVEKGRVIIKRRGRGQTNQYYLPSVNADSVSVKKSQFATSRSINLRLLEVANCNHHDHEKTQKGKDTLEKTPSRPPARKRARGEGEKVKSQHSYEECERYAASLKGIRSSGGFARTIHRSSEADKQITEFLVEEAERAARKAEEEARKRADLIRIAEEIKAEGGPRHEWERQLVETAASYSAASSI